MNKIICILSSFCLLALSSQLQAFGFIPFKEIHQNIERVAKTAQRKVEKAVKKVSQSEQPRRGNLRGRTAPKKIVPPPPGPKKGNLRGRSTPQETAAPAKQEGWSSSSYVRYGLIGASVFVPGLAPAMLVWDEMNKSREGTEDVAVEAEDEAETGNEDLGEDTDTLAYEEVKRVLKVASSRFLHPNVHAKIWRSVGLNAIEDSEAALAKLTPAEHVQRALEAAENLLQDLKRAHDRVK